MVSASSAIRWRVGLVLVLLYILFTAGVIRYVEKVCPTSSEFCGFVLLLVYLPAAFILGSIRDVGATWPYYVCNAAIFFCVGWLIEFAFSVAAPQDVRQTKT